MILNNSCNFDGNLKLHQTYFVSSVYPYSFNFQVDCTVLTPEPILAASGHVERFADLMVKDLKNGECFRLDHLIKAALEKVCADKKCTAETKAECEDIITKLDGATKEEQAATLKKFNIKSPVTNNDLSEPIEFNLMFQVSYISRLFD